MTLTTLVAHLSYESGNQYRIGLEDASDTIRLYWEEDEDDGGDHYWQCFTTFSALDDDDARLTDQNIVNQAKRSIVAHNLEPSGSILGIHF